MLRGWAAGAHAAHAGAGRGSRGVCCEAVWGSGLC
jgi:hypothetical protein